MKSACLSIICGAVAAVLPAADGPVHSLAADGMYTIHALWIEGGLGPAATDGDVGDIALGGSTFNENLEGEWRPGVHAGVEWTRTRVDADGDGWSLGVALWYDRAPGMITASRSGGSITKIEADLNVQMVSVAIAPAWAFRFSPDPLGPIAPGEWQLDAGPVFAVGLAQTQIDNGDPSDWGLGWQAGVRIRAHVDIGGGVRLGAYLGGMYLEARTRWQNTGEAVFQGFSPVIGLMLGREL